jgi:MFS family permease
LATKIQTAQPASTPQTAKGGGKAGSGWFHRTFDSLGNRNFRFMWTSMLLSTGAIQMQMLARGILVYEIQDNRFIAAVVGMGFAPSMLIVSLFAGVIGERFERRAIIQVSQALNVGLAVIVATLILFDAVNWGYLLGVSVSQGAMFAIQMPARQAAIPTLVGRDRMSNAIALNSVAMGLMNLVGPSLGGLLYGQFGPQAVYWTCAGIGMVAVGMTGMLPKMHPSGDMVRKRMLRTVADGFSYIGKNRLLMVLLVQSVVVAMLSMPVRMQIAVIGKDIYGSDPGGIGWLTAAAGVGALIGAIGIAGLRSGQRRGLVLMIAAVLSAVSIILMGSLPIYAVGIGAMVGIGLGESGRWALGQSLVMEQTEDDYRARVMSVLMMTFGLLPIGLLPFGAAMQEFGSQKAVLGIALMAVSAVFLIFSKGVRRLS